MITIETLQARYRLTPSEARLVLRLVEGECLREAASALGIKYGTTRSMLKAVFQKTATHRQAELMVLVLNGHDTAVTR